MGCVCVGVFVVAFTAELFGSFFSNPGTSPLVVRFIWGSGNAHSNSVADKQTGVCFKAAVPARFRLNSALVFLQEGMESKPIIGSRPLNSSAGVDCGYTFAA